MWAQPSEQVRRITRRPAKQVEALRDLQRKAAPSQGMTRWSIERSVKLTAQLQLNQGRNWMPENLFQRLLEKIGFRGTDLWEMKLGPKTAGLGSRTLEGNEKTRLPQRNEKNNLWWGSDEAQRNRSWSRFRQTVNRPDCGAGTRSNREKDACYGRNTDSHSEGPDLTVEDQGIWVGR